MSFIVPKSLFSPKYDPFGLYFGVEHEVDMGIGYRHCEDSHSHKGPDGIRDDTFVKSMWGDKVNIGSDCLDYGMENRIYPMTYGYIASGRAPFKKYFEAMAERGYKSNTPACGMHVHISKKGFGKTPEEYKHTACNLMMFWARFWDPFVMDISRRCDHKRNFGGVRPAQWVICKTPDDMWRNLRSGHPEAVVGITNFPSVKTGRKIQDRHGWGQCMEDEYRLGTVEDYYKLEAENGYEFKHRTGDTIHTVETRQWASTLNYTHFMATIEFLYDSVMFSKTNSWEEVCTINWGEYCTRVKHYRHLPKLMEELHVMDEDSVAGARVPAVPGEAVATKLMGAIKQLGIVPA